MKGEEEPVAQKYQQVSDEEETKVDNGKKEGQGEEEPEVMMVTLSTVTNLASLTWQSCQS